MVIMVGITQVLFVTVIVGPGLTIQNINCEYHSKF
jgi:hypothetical protein